MWNNLPVPIAAATPHDWFLLGLRRRKTVLLLLLLIVKSAAARASLALAVAALSLGIASGMPLYRVPLSFTGGVGTMMGHIAIVLGLGCGAGPAAGPLPAGAAFAGPGFSWTAAARSICPGQCWAWAFWWGCRVFFEVGLVLMMPIVCRDSAAQRTAGNPGGHALLAGLFHCARNAAASPGGDAGGHAIPRRPGPHHSVGAGRGAARRRSGRTGAGLVFCCAAGKGARQKARRPRPKRRRRCLRRPRPRTSKLRARRPKLHRRREDARASRSLLAASAILLPVALDLSGQLGRLAGRAGRTAEPDSALCGQRGYRTADCRAGGSRHAGQPLAAGKIKKPGGPAKADCGIL